jgi:hypothetical protein
MVDDHPMKVRALPGLLALAALAVGLAASPAQAATSQGCSGSLASAAAGGVPLGTLTVPGPGGTTASPFRLLWGEAVTWNGQTSEPVTTGTWQLTVQHPSWLFALGELLSGHQHGLTGTFESGGGAATFTNSFTPSSIEPVTLPGRYDVAFAVNGSGGVQCAGTLAVQVIDSPFRNPLFWLAFLLTVAGLVMLFFFGITKLTRPAYIRSNEREGVR